MTAQLDSLIRVWFSGKATQSEIDTLLAGGYLKLQRYGAYHHVVASVKGIRASDRVLGLSERGAE